VGGGGGRGLKETRRKNVLKDKSPGKENWGRPQKSQRYPLPTPKTEKSQETGGSEERGPDLQENPAIEKKLSRENTKGDKKRAIRQKKSE